MQHDYDVANQNGALFRADVNSAFQAGQTNNSGGSAPGTTYPFQFWADTGAGVLRMRNAANTAWVTIGLLGIANFGHLLPGSIVFHAKSAVPAGFLKANGGAVSRATYSDLFGEIGTTFGSGDGSLTFNVPDLRGEFLRGWDDSRGVDSGRGFGSWQADDFKSHFHNWGSNSLTQTSPGAGMPGFSGTPAGQTSSTGGSETRPRNVALLACIKY